MYIFSHKFDVPVLNMKILKNILSALLFLSLTFQLGTSQHFLSTNGTDIVNENGEKILLRGMGLGGWMLQEGYMLQTAEFANAQHKIEARIEALIGTEAKETFYDAWLSNHVTKTDIDSLKSWGFNSVRLPMHYNLFTLPIEDEPVEGQHTWLDKGFVLTDSLISWCGQNEMYVILDLHAAPGGQGQDQGISDYDPSKPSLWQSGANQDKTVALWKRLAERYADEQWVAGYDLLNEPNWNLPGNIALKNLYLELTDSIRKVDPRHIIFIEGNWFANDFTGLTPPWDDNLVYSPHKYWSINDQASIQWVLDIRKNFNVPLYFGESGENSNVWFRDAIRLFEDNDIGWAWWPMKKVESISGPLSVIKTEDYERLLNYWKGSGSKPSEEFATSTLMELAENLKIENCIFQKDVIDAMFRQIYSEETIPFNTQDIPGVVYATDFDMGVVGQAYYDDEVANYQVSTGNFSSWNNGWAYRNDGVDIQVIDDNINSNGYNVGWVGTDEWMQYDVNVQSEAIYDVHVRLAAAGSNGVFHFKVGDAVVSDPHNVQTTGGWETWATQIVPNVILGPNDKKLKFYADQEGFNVSSFEFIEKGSTSTISTIFMAAETLDENTIWININKYLESPLPAESGSFSIDVDGIEIPITGISLSPENSRTILLSIDQELRFDQNIRVSYNGNQINASDGSPLRTFNLKPVRNTLESFHKIPGKIEAEDYVTQSGIQLESTTDDGGGQNIGFLDVGDFLDYDVEVTVGGNYDVVYRTAGLNATGGIRLSLIDLEGNETTLDSPSFPATGGWQTWTSYNSNFDIPEGRYTLRITITRSQFNLNWIEFLSTEPPPEEVPLGITIYPNPSDGIFKLRVGFASPHNVDLELFSITGLPVFSKAYGFVTSIEDDLNLIELPNGYYFMRLTLEDGSEHIFKLCRID